MQQFLRCVWPVSTETSIKPGSFNIRKPALANIPLETADTLREFHDVFRNATLLTLMAEEEKSRDKALLG